MPQACQREIDSGSGFPVLPGGVSEAIQSAEWTQETVAALDDAGGRWNIVQAVTVYQPAHVPVMRRHQPGQSVTVHYQFTGGGEKGEHMPLADMEDDSINTIASAIEQMTGFIT